MAEEKTVAIIGCGLVGQGWAIVFATANYRVRIYDNQADKLRQGLSAISSKMADLEEKECLRGEATRAEALANIRLVESLQECITGAKYVQECVFEDFVLKRSMFEEFVNHVSPDTVLASSTGNIFASKLSEGLRLSERIIVAHPINPPHLVPLVEIIPAPWTAQSAIADAHRILSAVGQMPIIAKKETAGFIMCRIQHTMTAECFKLIRDDVISVSDLDKLMPYGLGLRYAFLGNLETAYLNANGMKHFCSLFGDGIYELQKQSGPPIKLEGQSLDAVQEGLEANIPLDQIEDRRKWRDDMLAELYKLKFMKKK